MRYKKTLMLLLVVFVIGILSACGKTSVGGLKAGEIKEISYDELINKLDNKETFLLLPHYYEFSEYVDSGLSEEIEKRLEEHGVGIYYARVYLEKENEEKYNELRDYLHPKNEEYTSQSYWRPSANGLVFVKEGKAITLEDSYNPFNTMMDISDPLNQVEYGDSITSSLLKYEELMEYDDL